MTKTVSYTSTENTSIDISDIYNKMIFNTMRQSIRPNILSMYFQE